MSRKVSKQVEIAAGSDVVWRALTDAGELARWFPVEARITPGEGGSIWLSWGGGTEGTAPITHWDAGRRLQWTEDRGPHKLAVDFHLEARGGTTVVRLVQSGFGDGADWDDEFHMTEGGWSYFMEHLKWYVERHPDTPRDLVSFREPLAMARAEAFVRLLGRQGLSTGDVISRGPAGSRYDTTTAHGDRVAGTIVAASPDTCQLGLTIETLQDAILFVEIEPAAAGSRAGFWLSTYGLGPARLADTHRRFERLYRHALELEGATSGS